MRDGKRPPRVSYNGHTPTDPESQRPRSFTRGRPGPKGGPVMPSPTLAPDAPGADPAVARLAHLGPVFANLAPAELVERALARGEGSLTVSGALAVATGARTGRSPEDKF